MATRSVGLEFEITSDTNLDTSEATKDLRNLGDAVDDVKRDIGDLNSTEVDISVEDQALDTLSNRIRDLRRQMSDDIELGVDITDTRKELSRAESDYRTLKRSIERDAIEVDVEVDSQGGIARAGESTAEFKREAVSNFSEVTSSFNGSMESIGDLAQGTFGGLAAGLSETLGGVKGLIAGLGVGAVAAGIGLAIGQLEKMEEAAQDARDEAGDLADEMIAAGESIENAAGKTERLSSLLSDMARTGGNFHWFWEDSTSELDDLVESTEQIGVALGDLGGILTGPTNELEAYISELERQIELKTELQRASSNARDYKTTQAIRGEIAAYEDVVAVLAEERDARASADQVARIYYESIGEGEGTQAAARREMEAYGESITEASDAAADAADQISDLYDVLTGNSQDVTQAQDDLRAAVRDVNDAIAANGDVMFDRNEAGEQMRDLLIEQRDETFNLIEAMVLEGASNDDVARKVADHNRRLKEQGDAAGLTEGQIADLIEEYGLVPEDVETAIAMSGADKAVEEAGKVKTGVDNIPDSKTVYVYADTSAAKRRMEEIRSTLAGLANAPVPSGGYGGSLDYNPSGRSVERPTTQTPINLVRVSIAGREVSAVVGSIYTTQRAAEQHDALVGVGRRP